VLVSAGSERGAVLGGLRSVQARPSRARPGRGLFALLAVFVLGAGTCAAPPTGAAASGSGPGVLSLAAGNGHSCAVPAAGTVQCWGLNADGELGNGGVDNAFRPVSVTGLTGVRSVTAGDYHACALLNGGTVKCWGYNFHGELGVSRKGPDLFAPVRHRR